MASLMFSELVWKDSTFYKKFMLGHLQIVVQTKNKLKKF